MKHIEIFKKLYELNKEREKIIEKQKSKHISEELFNIDLRISKLYEELHNLNENRILITDRESFNPDDSIYRHFKGKWYKVHATSIDANTGQINVLYQALYGECLLYNRELNDFLSFIDFNKYPELLEDKDGIGYYRFISMKELKSAIGEEETKNLFASETDEEVVEDVLMPF